MNHLFSRPCSLLVTATSLCLCLAACTGEEPPIKVLLAGNWADPTVVRVGEDYYLTANNDNHVPSVAVFHSKDLRNWKPLAYACPSVGQGPATDIAEYDGKLYIYGGFVSVRPGIYAAGAGTAVFSYFRY